MSNKKYDLKYFKNLAIKRGGECLSTEYVSCDIKIKFKCDRGHIWETKPYYLVHNSAWCPHCNKSAKDNIKTFQNIAKQHNGKCLSLNYINNRTKLKFMCEKGHIWNAKPSDVKNKKSWCPICSNSIKLDINKMQEIAKQRNGKCLSVEYVDSFTKLLWECEMGHRWKSRPNDIKNNNQWCPICNESFGERTINNLLVKLNINFIREHKFDDCKGKRRKLPFDFYLPEYNLLIEYDGKQHSTPVNFYGCSNDNAVKSYNELQKNDHIKNKYCKDKNIQLIRISHKINNIEEFLINKLLDLSA
jgi:hypothetical protein